MVNDNERAPIRKIIQLFQERFEQLGLSNQSRIVDKLAQTDNNPSRKTLIDIATNDILSDEIRKNSHREIGIIDGGIR